MTINNPTTINNCRVCNSNFFEKPLFIYKNMPAVAQNLPDKNSLEKDKGIDLEVYQCSGCGLVQLNNDPVYYYKDVIRASGFSKEMRDFRLKQFEDFVKNYSLEQKKVIEIGCGKGEFLSLMKQFNSNVFGLEHNESSIQHCSKNGLDVYQGFLETKDTEIPNNPYDAFFILAFLEHLPDPNSVLKGIYNNLSKNGIGLVEVPNFNMFLRKKLFSEFMRDHLFYFTKDTLETILKSNGFDILECNETWHDYFISAIVKKRDQTDISDFADCCEVLKKNTNNYVSRFKGKNVAIWGASHQAFTVLSLTGIADKIKYVVDSATFKQGKYTPATHIPIVSPAMLDSDPVDSVIIMAASYSDEVARIIREKYGNKLDIAILREEGLEEIL